MQVVRNGLRAVAFGGGASGQIVLRYLSANADIQNGDRLVTSGIDGTYPAGLPVATVVSIERDSDHSFARAYCRPTAGVDRDGLSRLSASTRNVPTVTTRSPSSSPPSTG